MATSEMKQKTIDDLFGDAMSGIKSDFGNNPNARTAELAVAEMHRRLKTVVEIGTGYLRSNGAERV